MERKQEQIVAAQLAAIDHGLDAAPYFEKLRDVQKQLVFARREFLDAERRLNDSEASWLRVQGIIHETRNLSTIWGNLSLEERRTILENWVN